MSPGEWSIVVITLLALGFMFGVIAMGLGLPELFVCTLHDRTPLIRWWHRRFKHGWTSQGICWACGKFD